MTAICLSTSQIRVLLKIFNEYGAKALVMNNVVQMTTTKFHIGKFSVWVDAWPNFSAVLIKWDWTELHIPRIKNYFYEFSLSNESLKQLLETPGLIELNQSEFVAITEERRAVIEDFAAKRGYELLCNNKYYDVFSVTKDKLINVPTPTDLIVGSLTPEWAELVTQNWSYVEEDKFDNYKEFIKLLIKTYPSTCLYNSLKQPIAYAIGQEYGGIGMLYVEPKYRGRGYAKVIMSVLSQKYLAENLTPFIVVDVKNLPSVNLNTKLGYESTQSRINWYTAMAKTPGK